MGVNVTGKNHAEGAEACINVIRELATNALKDACGFTNLIQATYEEIVAIYRAAM